MKPEIFTIDLTWNAMGKKFTYKEYSRLYTVRCEGKPDLLGTAAPTYLGSKYHYNPEEMLVMSLAACHMLSYLAYAANSKVEVLSYHDNATGELIQEGGITRFKQVTLNPQLTINNKSDPDKAKMLHEKAHHACFIANSVNFPVAVCPTIKQGRGGFGNTP